MNFYELYQIINEYGENLITNLIEKFKKEEPGLTPNIIKSYIDRFERIKNNLPEKDITKYSWKELENAVDGYQTKDRIKAGKLDVNVTDANLLYNQNDIRIYLGKDKKSCVKYGNGYSFCISARGEDNRYGHYRIENKGTPYFIFNDNLPKENPNHVLVLFVYNKAKKIWNPRYSITNALNEDEKYYKKLQDIINYYPWIKPITNFVDDVDKGDIEIEPLEVIEHRLKNEEIELSLDMGDEFKKLCSQGYLEKYGLFKLLEDGSSQELKDFLNSDLKIALIGLWFSPVLESGLRSNTYYTTYKNTGDILRKIKEKANLHYSQTFKAKEKEMKIEGLDSEYQEKIAKALKYEFKTMDGYLNNYTGEGSILKYDDGEGANVKFIYNENNYFLAKIVDISNIILTDKNRRKIEDFLKSKIKRNKILNWLKVQSKETLEKILRYPTREKTFLSSDEEKMVIMARNFTDFINKLMETHS